MGNKPAKIVILGDAADAEKALERIRAAAGKTKTKLDKLADGMDRRGKSMTRGVTGPLLALGGLSLKLLGDQEAAEAQLNAVIKSTGGVAGVTAEDVKTLASSLQETTTFGDEATIAGANLLLTFKELRNGAGEGNDVFDRTTAVMLDMATAMGTDASGQALQLGKALNDPIRGMAALQEVGVGFTDQQREQITAMQESGDIMGAQKIILAELESQFGGSAAAMAETTTGQLKQAMNELGDAGEQVGAVIAPVATSLAGVLKRLADGFKNLSPEAKEMIVKILTVAAVIGPLLIVGAKLIKGFQAIKAAFLVLKLVFAANPFILLAAAVIAIVALIVLNWDTIVEFLKGVWEWIKESVGKIASFFSEAFKKALGIVKDLFLNFTGPGLLIKHFDKIRAAVTKVKDWVVDKFNAMIQWLGALPRRVTTAVAGLFKKPIELATGVKNWIVDKFNSVIDFLAGIPDRISRVTSGMWDGIKNAFKAALNWIIDRWNGLQFSVPSVKAFGVTLGGFTLGTPDIPRFHLGGIYRAPTPGGEGLAILRDEEQILRRGASTPRAVNQPIVIQLTLDSRVVAEVLRDYEISIA